MVLEAPARGSNPAANAVLRGALFGAAPWVVAALLASMGWPRTAVLGRLALSLGQNLFRLKARNLKALEGVTLIYSVVEVVLTFGFGLWWVVAYGAVTSQAAMALMAVGSVLAGAPFTYQYAREAWPRDYWKNPLFLRTNAILSLGFGGSFSLGALASVVAIASGFSALWSSLLGSLVPPALGVGMGFFAAWFPKVYTRRELGKAILAREPHRWPVPRLPASSAEYDQDVVVVGSGIGGLTAAALLARRGLRVTVLEQHNRAGGCCTSWRRRAPAGDFLFDAGVHDISGLGPRGPVRHLLAELGIEDRTAWLRVAQRLEIEDVALDIPEDWRDFARALGGRFPLEANGVEGFFAEIEAVYREMYQDVDSHGGVPGPPATVDEMLAFPAAHPHMIRWASTSFETFLRQFIHDPKLERLLVSLASYLSMTPSQLSVFDMAPIFGYHFDGGFYPKGGSQAFADSLVRAIQETGGSVRLRTAARRIILEDGKVAGVEDTKGQRLRAPVVISNADLRRTFLELVGEANLAPEDRALVTAARPGPSAIMCFLGLDCVPDLPPFTRCRQNDERVGIAIPSTIDPSLAPPGHSSVTLLALVSTEEAASFDRRSADYDDRKRDLCDALIRTAERTIPGLREHIVFREDATPATFERYLWSTDGSVYGFERRGLPTSVKTRIPGLFLAGAGVAPGSGIEGVVISGTRVANAIQPDLLRPGTLGVIASTSPAGTC